MKLEGALIDRIANDMISDGVQIRIWREIPRSPRALAADLEAEADEESQGA